MNMGRISPPGLANSTNLNGLNYAGASFVSEEARRDEANPEARATSDLRSVVERRVMRMMEAHDRMRAQLLGPPQANS